MNLSHVTFQGPPIDDVATLQRLPREHRSLLEQINGFMLYGGALHVRGACTRPDWHALATVWSGEHALHRLYPAVAGTDVPFGQDCVGDQLLLREGEVYRLLAETGEIEPLGHSLFSFLEAVENDAVEVLQMHPLLQFYDDGGQLESGQLLDVYPPFCMESGSRERSLRGIPALERLGALTSLARQIQGLPEGSRVTIETEP